MVRTRRDDRRAPPCDALIAGIRHRYVPSARLVLDPDGALVAAGFVFHRDLHVTVHAWGLVGEAHQGLGRALLLHAFGEFHRRGTSKVSLHADAQSHTGATRLYETAGMHVDELPHESELELRSGVNLAAKASAG